METFGYFDSCTAIPENDYQLSDSKKPKRHDILIPAKLSLIKFISCSIEKIKIS